jgi:cytochrome P450
MHSTESWGYGVSELLPDVATPPRGFAPIADLLTSRAVPGLLASLAVKLSRRTGRPLSLGGRVIAIRHADVTEVLRRDLDFLIAPVNAQRITAVNGGPFVLGMDRAPTHMLERQVLYAALGRLDFAGITAEVREEAATRMNDAGLSFDAIAHYARPVAAATARRLFGIAPDDDHFFKDAVRAIFAHTFLNLGGDKDIEARALRAAPHMQAWLTQEIARRRRDNVPGDDLMGCLIQDGRLDDDAIRRTLGGMLVGAIDTTASTFARIFIVVASDRQLRDRMTRAWTEGEDIYGLCLDALRRWPHNPIVLRQAAADTTLGEVPVRAGSLVVAWTQAAMQDPEAFPDPERMLPDRPRDAYLHYGHGLHPCAGRSINAIQIPALVGTLLAAGADVAGKLQWAGSFPDRLPVRIP